MSRETAIAFGLLLAVLLLQLDAALSPSRPVVDPELGELLRRLRSEVQAALASHDDDPDALAFAAAADGTTTDKVSVHGYHRAYQRHLGPIKDRPLRLLEIGLGCGMLGGEGGSVELWERYLPRVELWILEFQAQCGRAWEQKRAAAGKRLPTMIYGDQSDRRLLKEIREREGPFDVIVDDGGHEMGMQIASLEELFPALRPGGLYFLEDVHTSFLPVFGGQPDAGSGTTLARLAALTKDVIGERQGPLSDLVSRVDCWKHLCVLQRKGR